MRSRRLAIPGIMSGRRVLADGGGLGVAVGFYVVVVIVLAALWQAAAESNQGAIAGYSAVALTWYIATSEAAVCALSIRLIEEIGDEISSGAVAVELLRPLPALAVRLAIETGRGLARLGAIVVAGVVLAVVLAGAPPNLPAALLAIPALALAITCNLVLQHAVAAASFWLRDARTTWFLYQKFVFILGGMLLPLEVLPDGLRVAAMRLPFMAMAYVPARLAAGHFEPGLLLVQVGWLAVSLVAATAAFTYGQRRLQVVGG